MTCSMTPQHFGSVEGTKLEPVRAYVEAQRAEVNQVIRLWRFSKCRSLARTLAPAKGGECAHFWSGASAAVALRSAVPGLNCSVRAADVCTGSPVRGLRLVRCGKTLALNVPKPRSSTRWPRCAACAIAPSICDTATTTSSRGSCGKRATSCSMMSDRLMQPKAQFLQGTQPSDGNPRNVIFAAAQLQSLSTALRSWDGAKGLTIHARAPAALPCSRAES